MRSLQISVDFETALFEVCAYLPRFLRQAQILILGSGRSVYKFIMVIVKIIDTAFLVWLISLFFALLESLWESRKNKIP